MSIKIITDSTSYIPQEYIDKYDIKVISLNVVMDLDSRRELDIDNITFLKWIKLVRFQSHHNLSQKKC